MIMAQLTKNSPPPRLGNWAADNYRKSAYKIKYLKKFAENIWQNTM
jgi:hypothetical protein